MRITGKYFKFKIVYFYSKEIISVQKTEYKDPPNLVLFNMEDIKKYPDMFRKSNYPEYKKRYNLGYICFVIIEYNRPAHYSWIAKRELMINEIERKITFGNNEIYIFDVFTAPEFRGKGLYFQMLQNIEIFSYKHNFNKISIYSEKANKASIKVIKKSGFQLSMKKIFIKFLGLKIVISL